MKRTFFAVAIAIVVAAPLAAAGASGRSASPARQARTTVFKVDLHITSMVVVHNGQVVTPPPSTESVGDSIYIVATLSQRGKKIGREDTYCAVTAQNHAICTSVDRFYVHGGGSIVHTGGYPTTGSTFLDAITGGTGIFTGARGTALAKFSNTTDAGQTYRISP
jgi:hypothetical protein